MKNSKDLANDKDDGNESCVSYTLFTNICTLYMFGTCIKPTAKKPTKVVQQS